MNTGGEPVMDLVDFHAARAGRAECPSHYLLDCLAADELPMAQAATVRAHAAQCAACGADLEASLPPSAHELLQRLRAQAPQLAANAPPERRSRARRAAVWLGAPLALAAACALVLLLPLRRPPEDAAGPEPGRGAEDVVRAKGGAAQALHVHRLVDGRSEEVASGVRLAPGARLRFVVDLPAAGTVAVVGVESGGALYPAWPLQGEDPRRLAGSGQALPGAVALDQVPGRETLYLVHCPGADGAAPRCTAAGASAPPACPRGCALSAFVIDKGPEPLR